MANPKQPTLIDDAMQELTKLRRAMPLNTRGQIIQPAWCEIHQHRKWCQHNGGVLGDSGYEAPDA